MRINIGELTRRLGVSLEELQNLFKKIDVRFLTASIKTHAKLIVDRARVMVSHHRLTGSLDKAVAVHPGSRRPRVAQVAVGLRGFELKAGVRDRRTGKVQIRNVKPWKYGKFFEHGFRHAQAGREIPPDPFMGPAFDENADQVATNVQEDVRRELGL